MQPRLERPFLDRFRQPRAAMDALDQPVRLQQPQLAAHRLVRHGQRIGQHVNAQWLPLREQVEDLLAAVAALHHGRTPYRRQVARQAIHADINRIPSNFVNWIAHIGGFMDMNGKCHKIYTAAA